MSSSTVDTDDLIDETPDDDTVAPRQSVGLRRSLLAIIAIAVLVLAATLGWAVRGGGSSGPAVAAPTLNSVDVGFAQDMAVHHTQAVTMAGYERDNTTNSGLKVLAFDIETEQQLQIGEMEGWLDSWHQPYADQNEMAWMGHPSLGATALMPGMATPAQMSKLESSHGKALDILFLQLMIHHHQGGAEMAQYAAEHATEAYVRQLAGTIYATQGDEIVQMEQLLRQLGGTPLPAPAD